MGEGSVAADRLGVGGGGENCSLERTPGREQTK